MHVDLIEILRCPHEHAESALVVSATRQLERRILHGTLGCPLCGAEYSVRDGVADFRSGAPLEGASRERHAGDEAAVRLAAQLDLTEPGRRVLLCGAYAPLAPPLSVMFDAMCLTIGAAPADERHIAAHASVLRIDNLLPLAPASLHGIAGDAAQLARLTVDSVHPLLRPRGRLVAPADTPPPQGMEVLARDGLEWVAERGSSDVVPLKRAAR